MFINIIKHVPIRASLYIDTPIKHPMADAPQIVAAVVRPLMLSPFFINTPAPIKPIPETTCAIIRELSPPNIVGDIKQNNVLPNVINDIVFIPTALP